MLFIFFGKRETGGPEDNFMLVQYFLFNFWKCREINSAVFQWCCAIRMLPLVQFKHEVSAFNAIVNHIFFQCIYELVLSKQSTHGIYERLNLHKST